MTITFIIKGQVRGGKNSMAVTRTGIHYPRKPFALWRNNALRQVMEQRAPGTPIIDCKAWSWHFTYIPEDRRRRDAPAVLDAVFHVLERANIVADDSLIKHIIFIEKDADKENPRIEIQATSL